MSRRKALPVGKLCRLISPITTRSVSEVRLGTSLTLRVVIGAALVHPCNFVLGFGWDSQRDAKSCAPSGSIGSRPKSGYTNDQPIRKLSALAAFVIAVVGGISSWHGSQLISGNHFVYSPYWEYHALWMTMFATLVCVFDFKKVIFVWAGLYCGTYAAHFIFFPPDPLVPLGMICGVAHTAFFSYVGMVLGICLDYLITPIWRARKSRRVQ